MDTRIELRWLRTVVKNGTNVVKIGPTVLQYREGKKYDLSYGEENLSVSDWEDVPTAVETKYVDKK